MNASRATRFGGFILSALLVTFVAPPNIVRAAPEPCGDVQVIWARGSGATIGNDAQYNQFYLTDLTGPSGRIGAGVSVSVYQLGQDTGYGGFQYPAAGDDWTLVTGEFPILGPEYANSVAQGRQELVAYASDRVASCPNEVLVLAGYSQGAQVIGEGLRDLAQSVRDRIAYVALFGDPTLVTGNNMWAQVPLLWFPDFCSQPKEPWIRGSIYCGSLGGIYDKRDPYVPSDIALRVGSWCRDDDGVCSGGVELAIEAAQQGGAHFQYFAPDSDSAFAAREVAEALQIFVPAHSDAFDASWNQFVFGATGADLAIVFDTTGSMSGAIEDAKAQATNVAQTWLDFFHNGRVGLVEFKDQGDPFVARVDLGLTNDVNAFQTAVNGLTADGGGDYPEAQLSGVMTALDGLDWAAGATKVTIVITDAPGKDPEPITNYTRESVSQHALEIDPVSIYGVNVSGGSDVSDFMTPLTSATAGQVFVLQPGQTLSDALFDVLDTAHTSPVAKLDGPYIAPIGAAITLSAADSFDASADITSYEWDFDGDGTVDRTTATPVTTYTYPSDFHGVASVRVIASDDRSAIATGAVTVDDVGLRDQLPLAPTSASASISGADEVTVTWSPAANDRASGYKVFLADGTAVGFKLASDAHSAVVGGLDLGQPITFMVLASNDYGNSPPAETSLGGPEVVNDDTGTANQQDPRATVGLDGSTYAVWGDARNSASVYDVYFASRDAASGSWSANERVDDSTASISSPAVAVDAGGNAYAIWVDARRGDADIWFSKRDATTGTWSASVRVNDDPAGSTQSAPAIAVSSTGEAIAIWVDGRSKKANIYSARLAAGASTWSANYKASSNSTLTKTDPDLAMRSDGIAYAVWTQHDHGASSVRFSTLPSGGTIWPTDVLVSDGNFNQLAGRIRVDTAGDLVLTGQLGSNSVWARYRLAGSQTWSTPTYVATTSNAFSNSLSMRGNGVAYVAWTDINNQVYGASWDPTTHVWSAQHQLTATGVHFTPSVALDSTSAVVVTADYATTYDIRGYVTEVP